ncbi:MAG: FecR domain-containing protein, partial [Sneathiella sp.]
WMGGMACAFLICILCWQIMTPPGMDKIATHQDRAVHRLPDGSVAKLDFGSNAVIDYEEASRTLRLSGGAVYVDVKANKKRPFRVQLGDIIVEAIGTAYSVEELASGEEVVVHEGIVSIRTADNAASGLRLKAGQKWRRAGSGGAETVTSDISASRAYWNKDHIIAKRTSLANILEKMSRHQGENILWIDPDIQHIQVSGLFQLSRSSSLSTLFLRRYNIEKYTLFENQVIFYKKN